MLSLLLPSAINSTPEKEVTDQDLELMVALRKKEMKAFSELFKKYAPALLGIIDRILQSREAAEEVLQTTFLRIADSINEYNPEKERLFTWMAKLARKAAAERLNAQ